MILLGGGPWFQSAEADFWWFSRPSCPKKFWMSWRACTIIFWIGFDRTKRVKRMSATHQPTPENEYAVQVMQSKQIALVFLEKKMQGKKRCFFNQQKSDKKNVLFIITHQEKKGLRTNQINIFLIFSKTS